MKFFWPIRKTTELAETVEDPYEEKSRVQPKQKRRKLLSSSSDDSDSNGEKCKRFGTDLDSDGSSSSDSSDEEQTTTATIQEITTIDPNDDEDNEFEVSFYQAPGIDPFNFASIIKFIFLSLTIHSPEFREA